MSIEPPAPEENTPSQPSQASEQPQPALASRRSQMQMSFVLAPGTHIRVRVESLDAEGKVAAAQTVTATQADSSEVIVPLPAQGEARRTINQFER